MAKKKRLVGRPKTTGKGTLISVRCQPEFLAAIDSWRGGQPGSLSRPHAIRWLAELGLSNSQPKKAVRGTPDRAATDMAARTIDRLADPTASADDLAKRKRRLLKGPGEFRDMRDDQPRSRRQK